MIPIGILGSTRGTHLLTLIAAIQRGECPVTINCVVSNKQDALILARAQSFDIPTFFMDSTHLTREAYDQQLTTRLHQQQVEWIVLMGYMRILSAEFVASWRNKIINVHPSLLPAFAGQMDLAVHQAVLAAGQTKTGCTVHYVTEEVDAGPIILQKQCEVYTNDTAEILKSRVQQLEGEALIEALSQLNSRG